MKLKLLSAIIVLSLSIFSCSWAEYYEENIYYKCFFIDETTFTIEGEVFTNDSLTDKAEFSGITVKVDSIKDWEIAGTIITGNKFELSVDTTANGINLTGNTALPVKEIDFLGHRDDFPYYALTFYVDGRRARGALEPEFGELNYYVYVQENVSISKTEHISIPGLFSTTNVYYHYDLIFSKPGWYRIYYSEGKLIGNKAEYSSGKNTKIRAPL